ncbi:MAG: hypothetical protein EB002_12620, partial [Betaproteobacteria bacterium]|nr:hypothetical protein [Betaproteobacteria bacterium]
RPLHTHALPWHMPGQPGCVVGHIVCTVVSVTASTAHMLHFNLVSIHTKRKRQIFAQWKNTLRVTPHFQTTAGLRRFPNRQRHTGPHRPVVQCGTEINSLVKLSLSASFLQLTCLMKHLRIHRRRHLPQINTALAAIRQGLNIPRQQSLQLASSRLGQFFSRRNNANQTAIPKHLDLFRHCSQSVSPSFVSQRAT